MISVWFFLLILYTSDEMIADYRWQCTIHSEENGVLIDCLGMEKNGVLIDCWEWKQKL